MFEAIKTPSQTRWAVGKIPQFKGLKALVLPGAFFASAVQLMAEAGFERATTVEDADVVVFIGGADINPALYGEKPMNVTSFSQGRDDDEVAVYYKAQGLGKIMFGICRGAQFLHAMNGGKLWQHVEGHGGADHDVYDIEEDVLVKANSYHHQMLMDSDDLKIIAVCNEQVSRRFLAHDTVHHLNAEDPTDHEIEIEAGAYEDKKIFFVQGHPEVGTPLYRSWCMTKLHDYCQEWLPHGIKGMPQTPAFINETALNAAVDVVG